MNYQQLKEKDPQIYESIKLELQRQNNKLEMIASENFTSEEVMLAQGSVMTNKYAEGYPGRRYYGGCEYVDIAENLAKERLMELFGAEAVNVQPHSGSQANMAVYMSMLEPGDKVLGMDLSHGGHLTHGMAKNFSGILYNFDSYGVDPETETIDYDALLEKAKAFQPKILVVGASAYPRTIDFKRMREIADEVSCLLFVDMAHIAGLVAAKLHPSPVPYADFVTSTTHKTLRGPRGGVILCKKKYIKKINSAVFPGLQGGPLMHVIAAKAVAFREALSEDFVQYQKQVIQNAQALAAGLMNRGVKLVANGTDTHLLLVDLRQDGISGKELQDRLDAYGITVNMNSIPFDEAKPTVTSGVRIGTPALTTRGFTTEEMDEIAGIIYDAIHHFEENKDENIHKVQLLCEKHPLYPGLMEG